MSAGDAEFGVLCATTTSASRSRSAAASRTRVTCRRPASATTSAAATRPWPADLTQISTSWRRRPRSCARSWRLLRHGHCASPSGRPSGAKIFKANFHPQRKLVQLAQSQLGTVGSGNHYVDLMEDEAGRVSVGVLRLARLRPQDGLGLPGAGQGQALRRRPRARSFAAGAVSSLRPRQRLRLQQ